MTITSVVDTVCCNPPDGYIHEPYWLAKEIPGVLGLLNQGIDVLAFHIDPSPGLAPPQRGQVVEMTGHFDDPAAGSCSATIDRSGGDNANSPLVSEAQVFACRIEFVVDEYEVVGIESMPPCCG